MFKTTLLPLFLLTPSLASALENPVIEITKFERTSSSIVVEGTARVVPPGTKMWVIVKSINGKPVDESRNTIQSMEDVFISNDGTFKATIKRYGSLDRYTFPNGKYQIEFYASFSRAWQSIEVAKAAGVKLDAQGRSDLGEPRALPRSSDLRPQAIGGTKVRFLKALRTIDVRRRTGEEPVRVFAPSVQVSKIQFRERWPLTVNSGTISCDPVPPVPEMPNIRFITFTSNGRTYALNGIAMGYEKRRGWLDIRTIWKDDPNPAIPGQKIDISPLINLGLPLCM